MNRLIDLLELYLNYTYNKERRRPNIKNAQEWVKAQSGYKVERATLLQLTKHYYKTKERRAPTNDEET